MEWFMNWMTGEIHWIELIAFSAVNNIIIQRFCKGPKGDTGEPGMMGQMGLPGKDGKNELRALNTAFEVLKETNDFKEWKAKRDDSL